MVLNGPVIPAMHPVGAEHLRHADDGPVKRRESVEISVGVVAKSWIFDRQHLGKILPRPGIPAGHRARIPPCFDGTPQDKIVVHPGRVMGEPEMPVFPAGANGSSSY